jgi:hypothetical protein
MGGMPPEVVTVKEYSLLTQALGKVGELVMVAGSAIFLESPMAGTDEVRNVWLCVAVLSG